MALVTTPSRLGVDNNLEVGATRDLLLIKFSKGYPEGKLTFNIDLTPRSITGIQKVAQVFLKILFTNIGSNVLSPLQGTRFSELVVNSNIVSSDAVLMSELKDQIKAAESQTKYSLGSGTDIHSQLREITILGLDVNGDSATMFLKLVTKAGEFAQVAVPFPQSDMQMSPGA